MKNKVTIPENMLALIKNSSMLAYIWGEKEAVEFVTTKEMRVTTHGQVIEGELINCLVGFKTIPAGTKGLVISQPVYSYSKYVWIGDEQYPASDAEKKLVRVHYTFLTLLKDGDHEILGDSFETVEKDVNDRAQNGLSKWR